MALKVTRLDALLVLVEQAKEVDVRRCRSLGRAAPLSDPIEEALVEPARVINIGMDVTVSGPPNLADDYRHGSKTVALERPDEGVIVGLEHVGVGDGAVDDGGGGGGEEGIVDGEVWIGVEAEEGVNVDGQRATVVLKETDDGEHEVTDVRAEVAAGGEAAAALVDVGVEGDSDSHLPTEAGLDQRCLDVLQRCERRVLEHPVVGLQKRLVADRHMRDIDAVLGDVGGDVICHPLLGDLDTAGERCKKLVGNADHDLDAGAAEGTEGTAVCLKELHLLEVVVPEEAHHDVRRQWV